MKKIILVLAFICCVYIGVLISSFYRKRKKFFNDLCSFCEMLKINIAYAQEKLPVLLVNNLGEYGQEFSLLLSNFLSALECHQDFSFNTKNNFLNFLTKNEKNLIQTFFCKLGEMSSDEEIEKIVNSKIKFDALKDKSEKENAKYATFYIKFFSILGLILVVIFL